MFYFLPTLLLMTFAENISRCKWMNVMRATPLEIYKYYKITGGKNRRQSSVHCVYWMYSLMLFIYLFWFVIYFHSCRLHKFLYAALPAGRFYFVIHTIFKFSKPKSELIILNAWIQICLWNGIFYTLLYPHNHEECNNKNSENHPESQTGDWRQIIGIWTK